MTNIFNREIAYGDDCRERIMKGVNGLADAVAVTMGPKGKNVVIKLGLHDPRFTKDGVTVARNVFFPDEFMNMGAEIIAGVALRTGARAGDGTTTSTVLARSLLTAKDPIVMAQVEEIIAFIKNQAIPVKTREDYYNVALVSSNNDHEVATLIADTIQEVGMDGLITIELSPHIGLKSEVISGMSIPKGYASPYFVTNTEKMIAELDNPKILVLDKHIHTLEQIFDSLNAVAKAGHSMLIVAREIGGDALQTLLVNKVKNGVRVCPVSCPTISNDFLEDIAIATGASLTERTFGSAKKVIIHHDHTIIMEGGGDKAAIEDRCAYLRENKMKERLARLSGGVAVLKVGGSTEAEASERRDRVDDALNAVKSAIEEGIVSGGGMALYRAGFSLPDGAVKTATQAPVRQILKNAGLDPDAILAALPDGQGYDARGDVYCDMVSSGIIDPAKVVMSALRDAASVSSLVARTEAAIVEKMEKK